MNYTEETLSDEDEHDDELRPKLQYIVLSQEGPSTDWVGCFKDLDIAKAAALCKLPSIDGPCWNVILEMRSLQQFTMGGFPQGRFWTWKHPDWVEGKDFRG